MISFQGNQILYWGRLYFESIDRNLYWD